MSGQINKNIKYLIACITFIVLLPSCYERVNHKGEFDYEDVKTTFFYHLSKPDDRMTLTIELEEISGLTWINDTLIGAIQDELGHMYYLNPENGNVEIETRFEGEGDFEGVEMVGDEIFAIKSNGKLYRFPISDKDEESELHSNPLNVSNNVEGLTYWPERDLLLISCKDDQKLEEEEGDDDEDKEDDDDDDEHLLIYGFEVKGSNFIKEPVITVDEDEIEDMFEKEYKGKFEGDKFAISAMSYHPIENSLYLISSPARLLVIVSMEGKVKAVYPFERDVLRQPEGMCVSPDGTLFISSEGRGGDGYIVKYRYRK